MRQVGYYTGTPGESLSADSPGSRADASPHACRRRRRDAPPAAGVADLQALRQQLAAASLRLHTILDANWRSYLAMPAEIYAGDRPASVAKPSADAWPL